MWNTMLSYGGFWSLGRKRNVFAWNQPATVFFNLLNTLVSSHFAFQWFGIGLALQFI
jgi:hypothetical protein